MAYLEAEVVAATIGQLANRGQLPEFMQLLPGVPRLRVPLRGMIGVDTRTGEPVAPRPIEQEIGAIAADEAGAAFLRAIQQSVRSDLAAISEGRLSRKRKEQIAHEASRVTVKTSGDQRGKRPAYLEIPDLQAAIGYVLHIIAARRYSRVLAQCKFDDCGNFFLRAPSSAAGMLLLRGARETRQARRDRRSWA
jgi:hypothetical protein